VAELVAGLDGAGSKAPSVLAHPAAGTTDEHHGASTFEACHFRMAGGHKASFDFAGMGDFTEEFARTGDGEGVHSLHFGSLVAVELVWLVHSSYRPIRCLQIGSQGAQRNAHSKGHEKMAERTIEPAQLPTNDHASDGRATPPDLLKVDCMKVPIRFLAD